MIKTGAELLAAVEAAEVTHEEACLINEALPERERVYPPDLQGWIDPQLGGCGTYWQVRWDEWDALNARYQELRRRKRQQHHRPQGLQGAGEVRERSNSMRTVTFRPPKHIVSWTANELKRWLDNPETREQMLFLAPNVPSIRAALEQAGYVVRQCADKAPHAALERAPIKEPQYEP